MKLLVALVPLVLTLTAMADTPPELPAKSAVEIAEQTLASRKLGPNVFIQAVSFQSTALLGGKRTWFVQWSGFVEGSKPGTREIGLQIGMDGHVIHVIKEPGSGPTGSRPR